MGREIERKFLVVGEAWRTAAQGELCRQGFLANSESRTVRVRRLGEGASLTIKGAQVGATRREYEYPIPVADADEMLDQLCEGPLIEKRRFTVRHGDHVWEVDEFLGDNAGLVVAEVELASEDEAVALPPWVGEEVTHDPRYLNANLVRHPYGRW